MTKCVRCGKNLFLKRKMEMRDAVVCESCGLELGFDKFGHLPAYSYEDIKDGYQAYWDRLNAIKKAKEDASYMFVVWDDIEVGKLQRKLNCADEYEGYTNKDIKELFDEDDKCYRYEQNTLDVVLTESELQGKPTYEVSLKDYDGKVYHVGHCPPKSFKKVKKIIEEHDPDIEGIIAGGEYKYVYDGKVEKDDDNAYVRIVFDWYRETDEK